MKLPFSVEQFLDVFSRYNAAIWPAQVVAYVLAVLVLWAVTVKAPGVGRIALLVLAAFWAWNGIVYQFLFFRPVNPAASAFAALFMIQALLLALASFAKPQPADTPLGPLTFGWIAVAYASVGYPALSHAVGHSYPRMPMLGVAPCPTTIFTFGLLLLLGRRVSGHLFVLPVLWAAIATSAAIQLGMIEDYGLATAAVIAVALRLFVPGRVNASGSHLQGQS